MGIQDRIAQAVNESGMSKSAIAIALYFIGARIK